MAIKKRRKVSLTVVGRVGVEEIAPVYDQLIPSDQLVITWVGQVATRQRLRETYDDHHFGISMSYLDPCPNSVIEMLACGLPVIMNEGNGVAEVFESGDVIREQLEIDFFEAQTIEAIASVSITEIADFIECKAQNYAAFSRVCQQKFKEHFDLAHAFDAYHNLR